MRARAPLLLALLVACGKGNPTRLFPRPPACQCTATQKCLADGSTCAETNYVEAVATPATCGEPVVVSAPHFNPDSRPGVARPVGIPIPGAGEVVLDFGVKRVGSPIGFDVPADTAAFTIVLQAASDGTPDTVGNRFPNVAVPDLLTTPGSPGTVIYDDINVPGAAELADPAAADLLVFFASFSSTATGTFTFPNTSRALRAVEVGGLTPGRWTFLVNDWAYECFRRPDVCGGTPGTDAGTYQVHVFLKRAGAGTRNVPAAGRLDVAVHVVDGTGSTSAPVVVGVAPGDFLPGATRLPEPERSRVQRFVPRLAELLRGAGVCLGTVTFYDAPTWARDAFATGVNATDSGYGGPLAQLSTLSGPEPADVTTPRLHLFLVSRIVSSSTNGTSVVGIDGTIPGPGGVSGTVRSGAAVSMEDLLGEDFGTSACSSPTLDIACGADQTAYIAAHEAGHFLGLYHVTEGTGSDHDPITDTPRCVCALCSATPDQCGASAFLLTQSTCIGGELAPRLAAGQAVEPCGGGRNLMFWLLGSRSLTRGILSPDQGQVIRTSPAVSHPSPP